MRARRQASSHRALPGFVAAAITSLLLTTAQGNASASPQARIVYGRSPDAMGCPDENALRAAVASRIGYDPFFPSAPRTVVASIERRGHAFIAKVHLVDDQSRAAGAREISSSSDDCTALFETMALTISIAIDPRALAAAPPAVVDAADAKPVSPPPPSPVAEPAPAPQADELTPPTDAPAQAPRVRLGADLRGAVGLLPGPAAGLGAGVEVAWARASLGLEVSGFFPSSLQRDDGVSVRAWAAGAALLPCLHADALQACAVASVGRLEGSASGVVNPATRDALMLGAGGRIGLSFPLSASLAFRAHVDALFNLDRHSLTVGADAEWRAPLLSGALGVGLIGSI